MKCKKRLLENIYNVIEIMLGEYNLENIKILKEYNKWYKYLFK